MKKKLVKRAVSLCLSLALLAGACLAADVQGDSLLPKAQAATAGPVQTVPTRDAGVELHLFDYNKSVNTHRVQQGGGYRYPLLRFFNALDGAVDGTGAGTTEWYNQNQQTVSQNMVQRKLVNGMPFLSFGNAQRNYRSLDYLFDPAKVANSSYGTAYTGLDKLFVQDAAGYYSYDSRQNHAYYSHAQGNKNFQVYNYPICPWNMSGQQNMHGQFLPFNAPPANPSAGQLNTISGPDLWFGMTMGFSFIQPKDGKLNGNPMRFTFSGDDDVLVFIDDVLVLDLGGVHPERGGFIDFSTGRVQVDNKSDTTIKEQFQKAQASTSGFRGNTFADYGTHTLKFFYMERGGYASNCKIRFNLPPMPKGTLNVIKEVTGYNEALAKPDQNFTFTLKKGGVAQANRKYTLKKADGSTLATGTTNAQGQFQLKDGQMASFSDLEHGSSWTVAESAASGYSTSVGIGSAQPSPGLVSGSVTIQDNSSQQVVFRNALQAHQLILQKRINGPADNSTRFTFQLRLRGAPYTGKYTVSCAQHTAGHESSEAVATADGKVTLHACDTIRIAGLPAGTSYQVTEVDIPQAYATTPAYDNCTGTIGTADSVATVTNALYGGGQLTVKKTVQDNKLYDPDDSFLFRVYKGEGAGKSLLSEFALQNGESLTLTGLAAGRYTVEEDSAWSARYQHVATAERASGDTKADGIVTVQRGQSPVVTVTNKLTNDRWIGDETSVTNVWSASEGWTSDAQ